MITININGEDFRISMNDTNIHIHDSFKINNEKDMISVLNQLKELYKGNNDVAINKLTFGEMLAEWKAHNVLCFLSFLKKRTCDVDLNTDNLFLMKLGYKILSFFTFIIKK